MGETRGARLMLELQDAMRPTLDFLLDSPYAQRQGDPTICDLVLGNPHDPPLPGIAEAIARHSKPTSKDHFAYTPGDEGARAAAAAAITEQTGVEVDAEDVFLTGGAFGAISVILRAIVDPDDEVVFVSPPWFFYEPMIRLAGGTAVRVHAQPPSFDLPVDAIRAAITERTRAVLINTPHNPSGRVYDDAALRALAQVLDDASQRHGRTIYLLSDESYRRIVFDGATFVPPASIYPATFMLYTYGKTLLAPGERLGHVALPRVFPDREQLRMPLFFSQVVGGWQFPNTVLQYALGDLERLIVDVPRLQARRDRLVDELTRMGFEVTRPDGTFYIMVRSPLPDEMAFLELLAEHDIFVLPGRILEQPGWFRLSVTANDDMIERALPGFEKALAAARG